MTQRSLAGSFLPCTTVSAESKRLRTASVEAKYEGQSQHDAIYNAQQFQQEARDCGQSWCKSRMTVLAVAIYHVQQ